MSESTGEIVEITDSSINIEASLQESTKRRLSYEDEKLESDTKKFCPEIESENFETSSASIIIEPTLEDTALEDDDAEQETSACIDDLNNLNSNIDQNKKLDESIVSNESECLLEEIHNISTDEKTVIENEEQEKPDEEIIDKSGDVEDLYASENENSGEDEQEDDIEDEEEEDDIDDDALMMNAMNALTKSDEPIALDSDTEDEAEENQMTIDDDDEEEDIEEEEEEEREDEINKDDDDDSDIEECEEENKSIYFPKDTLRTRIMAYNPRFYLARVLVKKSMKILYKRQLKRKSATVEDVEEESENVKEPGEIKKDLETEVLQKKVEVIATAEADDDDKSKLPKQNDSIEVNKMEISSDDMVVNESTIMESDDVSRNEPNCSKPLVVEEKSQIDEKSNEKPSTLPLESKEAASEKEIVKSNNVLKSPETETNSLEKSSNEINSQQNDSSQEIDASSLLHEIQNFSVDDIMSRYVSLSADQTAASMKVDEFTEELFYCLQQNKVEIQKAQQIWNEKVHTKFKIREIMERIRRHRAVNDIENFGFKPSQENLQSNSNILISSKSSTTNSENEPYERSSKLNSETVNRLIQDVRTNVLKKEKKNDDFSSSANVNDSFDDSSSYGINMQGFQSSNSNIQGRQGQIIDVQSIINDFRQKNPQEIPRRGRRMKGSFDGNYMMENQMQSSPYTKNDKSYSTVKSNSPSGFPEVSLLPVNNFYKNHSNASSSFGQKSSLLQSILTKQQTTKSPSGYNSSTLARLLTAPERSFQNAQRQANMSGHTTKVHNNGEITITPIAGTSKRQDFSMDDEENSTEPPLVIDESDDFDMSERTRELLCQGCRRNKALFMCAGCSRQWYCSKECQELAWNDHENSCF